MTVYGTGIALIFCFHLDFDFDNFCDVKPETPISYLDVFWVFDERTEMDIEKSVVIAEQQSELAAKLGPLLMKNGYQVQVVHDTEGIIRALNVRNRISVLLVDDSIAERSVSENISIIKKIFSNVFIITTTNNNSPEKEKNIRKEGVFYYHIGATGIDDLITAISCAMTRAIEDAVSFHGNWAKIW